MREVGSCDSKVIVFPINELHRMSYTVLLLNAKWFIVPIPIDLNLCYTRRLPCETNQKALLAVFTNQTVNEELRIAAYIQLMKCPSYPILKAVKYALIVEEYNQGNLCHC